MNIWSGKKQPKLMWSMAAGIVVIGVFVWMYRSVDIGQLISSIRQSDPLWIVCIAASIIGEQLIRGWKWRQLIFDLRPISSVRLYGAIVAGYFANMVVPIGVSPFVRSWLIARLEQLHFATIVMTTAIERFIDGVLFAVLVMIVAIGATLPASQGDIKTGLIVAGIGGFSVFAGLLATLYVTKSRVVNMPASFSRALAWFESRFGQRFSGLGDAISQGIVWPRSRWRSIGVVLAAVAMKAISVTHFLWAGLAVGVALGLFDYMFLTAFAGISLIAARFIRIPGGFVIGSAYGLKLLAVQDEQALAMVLLVHFSSLVTTIVCGAAALWWFGIRVQDIQAASTNLPKAQS